MRILSGIQSSGKLHLGNYFGYVRPNIEWHTKAEAGYIMIADFHALTSVQDPKVLRENIQDLLLDLLSCGFDEEKTVIFRQSESVGHTELMWLLSTVSPIGLLERAVSYKEKVEKGIGANVGLFTYPVLQAADIVLYDIDKVPVGKDQKQHLEMSRDIAIKFNNAYGEVLTVPEGVVQEDVAVVPGVDGVKMSKSYGNSIPLFGDEAKIQKLIMSIKTDSKGPSDPKMPEECIPYLLHRLFLSPAEAKTLADEYRNGISYGDAKKRLFQAYMDGTASMRTRRAELSEKKGYLEEIAQVGATKARERASHTIARVFKAVGLS